MSDDSENHTISAEKLAELTGEPIEEFEYEGEIPDFESQEIENDE